jgi:hypothetical protein
VPRPGELHAGETADGGPATAGAILALQAARAREEAEEFRQAYAKRAGIEGTISHGVRTCGLRRSRYVGEAKTHLQHVATGAAINVIRISNCLLEKPREQTRTFRLCKVDGTTDCGMTDLPTVSCAGEPNYR